MLTALFAFLSGIVTVASPCVLPVLPFLLSGAVGGRLRPYGIILGFVASFTVVTLFLSALVTTLNIPPDTLRYVSIALLLGFGLVLWVPALHKGFEGLSSRSLSKMPLVQGNGFWGGTAVGATLGVLWTPCVGPIMAGVITLALSGSVNGQAALVTLAFSLGTALPMLAVMLGGRRLLGRIPGLMNNLSGVQRGFGVVMVLFAMGFFFGLDRSFQTWVLDTFPGYADFLTRLEGTGVSE
ncbi:cytochrome c biogenesis CcdA family protein [uncultured Meiothermus sp.]|jgi:cytochrome c biogenesis protein CcdA|uniref:cytochrome c biogenesis CcdA family protein n=1 Tax=uncultured Meiothermus sp. TaxID=157471 RepID=UPI002635F907|nr:cytochrome c biogenesis CcdA family protein [uncultured Meiothermus sp.]